MQSPRTLVSLELHRRLLRRFVFKTAEFIHVKDASDASGSILQPITGDWNGDGETHIGLRRVSTGMFYFRTGPTWNQTTVLECCRRLNPKDKPAPLDDSSAFQGLRKRETAL